MSEDPDSTPPPELEKARQLLSSAAIRALKDPSPSEVREKIHELTGGHMADGQLDDCQLTLKDLAVGEAAFTRVVTLGVCDSRIEYPPVPGTEAQENDDSQARRRRVNPLRDVAHLSS